MYIDDICCYSSGVGPEAEARHMRVLKAVMDRLAEWQVYISPNKGWPGYATDGVSGTCAHTGGN